MKNATLKVRLTSLIAVSMLVTMGGNVQAGFIASAPYIDAAATELAAGTVTIEGLCKHRNSFPGWGPAQLFGRSRGEQIS